MAEYTLQQLADHVGGKVRGDANLTITGVGTLQSAHAHQVAFLANSRYKNQLAESEAGAILLSPKDDEGSGISHAIVVDNPYAAFAKVAPIVWLPIREIDSAAVMVRCADDACQSDDHAAKCHLMQTFAGGCCWSWVSSVLGVNSSL